MIRWISSTSISVIPLIFPPGIHQAAAENYLAASVWIQELIETEKQTIHDAAGDRYDDIDIQITEYGPIGGSYPNSLAGAIFLASFFNVVLAEPKITAANHLPMINHYDAPNLLGSLLDLSVTGEEAYWDNIQTHVFPHVFRSKRAAGAGYPGGAPAPFPARR